ncbi:MAG: methyltransferase domain-containing protein, partial [Planctomycetota bacterium]
MQFDSIFVGCGDKRRDGWLNIDVDPASGAEIVARGERVGAIPDGSARVVAVRGTLEHLSIHGARLALAEWRRWLAPGGRLALVVADAAQVVASLATNDGAERHVLSRGPVASLWTAERLVREAREAGFADVEVSAENRPYLALRAVAASVARPHAPASTAT